MSEKVPLSEIIVSKQQKYYDTEATLLELSNLENDLVELQFFLADIKAELTHFNRKYSQIISHLYSELDEVKAQVAEALSRCEPNNIEMSERASLFRRNANDSTKEILKSKINSNQSIIYPSDDLKKLFREAAKLIHPDFSIDDNDKELRHQVMAQVNSAYENRDELELQKIIDIWMSDHEFNDSLLSSELETVLNKIFCVRKSISLTQIEIEKILKSDLYILYKKYKFNLLSNRDVLLEMAVVIKSDIEKERSILRKINSEKEFV